MLITRAAAAKTALIDLLQAQTATLLAGVQVDYFDHARDKERESMYLGAVQAQPAAVDGDPAIRLEVATVPLFIRVLDPAKTPEETDTRTVVLAQVVQDVLAANGSPLGPNSWWQVGGFELASIRTADESISVATVLVEVRSYL